MSFPPALTDVHPAEKTQPPAAVLSSDEWLALHDELRAFVRRRIGDAADADDVTQGVFLKLYGALPTVREPRQLRAWAYRAARNSVIDYYRTRSRACRRLFEGESLDTAAAAGPDVTAAARLASCIPPSLQQLSPDDRELLERFDVRGESQVAAARALDLTVSGMKSRVQRARTRLKRALERCCAITVDRRGGIADITPRRPDGCACQAACECDGVS
jgi:RNA polymerase sigma-70 factor (ECF subfamily)